MKSIPSLLTVALASAMLVGCSQQEQETPTTHTTNQPATVASQSVQPAAISAHGGVVVALGRQETGAFTVIAKQEGAVAAGQEAVFLIETSPASEAVRLWVGDEQATNSTRAKAEGGPMQYHAHAPVPPQLSADDRLWIEVQGADGERGVVAFDWSAAAPSSPAPHSDGGDTHSHEGEAGHSHAPAPTPAASANTHTHGDGVAHSH